MKKLHITYFVYFVIISLVIFNIGEIQKKGDVMTNWKKQFTHMGHSAEEHFDHLKSGWEKRFGKSHPVQIIAYYGYGTPEQLEIMGRVLRDKGISVEKDDDSLWDNILRMYKRMESDELPGVPITAWFQSQELKAVSDEEGYFKLAIHPSKPIDAGTMWQKVDLKADLRGFRNPAGLLHKTVEATGQILVPPKTASFGVISDVDDTIIRTGATKLLEMARNTFFKNARTRLPFPGVQIFYTALQAGKDSKQKNPIFYVSNGPWNLFDFLSDFMQLNGLPQGPILLRDFGIDSEKFIKDDTHKISQISHIMNTYPTMPFILIGDSGEKDPEIYQEIVLKFPGRIRAIYIRDVTTNARDAEVKEIAATISSLGVEMLLTEDTIKAAEHAAGLGLLPSETVTAIQRAFE